MAWLRDPANRVGPVGIADGFAGQTPFAAGSTSPRGLTALSKHPYVQEKRYPRKLGASAPTSACSTRPAVRRAGEAFVPRYTSYFPEYWLNAIQTETLVRDLAPETTGSAGVAHRRAGPRPPAAPRRRCG